VEVRETVPDRILDDATEVQFVDLPIQTLIDRLERGHIYPPERARQAREHFFRAGNLTALREVALRRTAAGVNDQLERYMHEHAIDDVWPAAERILALFDHRGSGDAITRQAWRFASALQGDLVVVAIVPPGGVAALPSAQRALIERHLQLAKDLGAETRLVEGTLTAEIAAAQIREENALVVVIGHKPEDRWRRAFRPSVIDDLLKLVDGVSILVVEQN
jgi:two-component system sensor histidine kinase KdpD